MNLTRLKDAIQHCKDNRRIYKGEIYFEKYLYSIEIEEFTNEYVFSNIIVEHYNSFEALETALSYYSIDLKHFNNFKVNQISFSEKKVILHD